MKITLVTGLWDIKRGDLGEGWARSFDHYLETFEKLLKVDVNLIVFGDEELKKFTFWENRRKYENTQFIIRDQEWFKNEFYDQIQTIRTNPDWYNKVGWLPGSTQAKLDMYNPLVMSKMMLLNDARISDKFDSDFMFWIDAGLANTVNIDTYITKETLTNLCRSKIKFHYLCFPYNATDEIHGFDYPAINDYAGSKVEMVARGGFFGGRKDKIDTVFGNYYPLMRNTLYNGLMGTEESLFSILCYSMPNDITYSMIEENGLVYKFFQDILDNKLKVISKGSPRIEKMGLYVITYNSPKQFETLCKSMIAYDTNLLDTTEKYLLNNSTDKKTNKAYKQLCKKYNFTELKKDNIGICGGRQFIAEHFHYETNLDAYMFYEDDMFFYNGKDELCRNGFPRKINNFLLKATNIVEIEGFDFIKFNFTEFFGDNHKQWAWHNVPQDVRDELFPGTKDKPFVKYNNIKSCRGLAYALGNVHYCNWPQIVTRSGNQKMFLDIVWDYPFEQTWMSYIYQESVKGNIKPGILLATPTEHDRFDHYPKEERKEN